MYENYFTFRSMTRAQLAVQHLKTHRISAELLRIPKVIASMGCGYAVRVHQADTNSTASALRSAGIVFERVFRLDAYGEAKEVYL